MKSLSLFSIMFLIMFTLKLAGPLAATSWWLVTLPLWGPAAAVLAFLAFCLLMAGVAAVVGWRARA